MSLCNCTIKLASTAKPFAAEEPKSLRRTGTYLGLSLCLVIIVAAANQSLGSIDRIQRVGDSLHR